MAGGLFIHSYNESSERYAILDEFEKTGVLYLSEKGSQKPQKDAFAYMQTLPIDKEVWKERMRAGEPPTLHTEIASNQAVITNTRKEDFSFKWSISGEAVALLYKGNPIAFIDLNEKYGFSKAVIAESPIVNPWDNMLYEKIFK